MPSAPIKVQTTGRLRHARVVFTGRLESMTRHAASALVRAAGGETLSSVSRRSTLLVVGRLGWPLAADGAISRSLRRAEELSAHGSPIEILSEDRFLERLGIQEAAHEAPSQYPLERVCSLLGLDPTTLRRWEVQGLVRSRGGQYDFRDLVSLRTIADLISRGVPPRTIAESIRGLARVLPGTDRPLSQLKIVEESGTLLAELGGALLAPDGQMVIDFQPDHGDAAQPIALRGTADDSDHGAAIWLERGIEAEEADRLEEAASAYRRALAVQPHFPEAHFNLGNALRDLGKLEAAEEHLLLAIDQDRALAAAWYNLADVQEERGRIDDAIASLRSALEAEPLFADAHYNIALLYEEHGRSADAARHWKTYLSIDRESPWAETAKRHLARRR